MKDDLLDYLRTAREALVWKLDGLSEHDARRPLTSSGSNLLGIVKHMALVEGAYFGEVFDRPVGALFAEDDEPNSDMWATAAESRELVVSTYQRVWAHSEATIAALDLTAPGRVRWWRGAPEVTLHRVLVHVVAETHRHAGHCDLLRELVDGAAGYSVRDDGLPEVPEGYWPSYVARLQAVADGFR